MRRCIYKKIHYLTFDLDLGVKVTGNVTQYPLHHVIYAPIKFEVDMSNGLGEDTITRNVTDGRTDRQTHGRTTDRLWYEINIPYFSYEKAGIKMDFMKMSVTIVLRSALDIWFTVNVLNFKLFSLSIFSIKMVIKAEVHKMLVKIANRKEPVQTASSNAV